MIKINNLTKIYHDKLRGDVKAIYNINLELPSRGIVFITGKSGSGKSTLLNMIGTLDNITSGDIIVDNYSYKSFKEKTYQEFRSSYLGFIFQEFLLLDDLTIYDNVELALNISNSLDKEKIVDILKRVGLADMMDRYPTELSGGQKQRVAIARALVKDPKILLCDEPTGNLDKETTKDILDILKEEALKKLVIIVSHNEQDAEKYADRIIELEAGTILSDVTKDKTFINKFKLVDNVCYFPHHTDLTKKNLEELNSLSIKKKATIMQLDNGFYDTREVDQDVNEFKLSSNHLSPKNHHKLSRMFDLKGKHNTILTIIITTLMICLMYIFQVFLSFNPVDALATEEITQVINSDSKLKDHSYTSSFLYPIKEETFEEISTTYNEGKAYPIYNFLLGTNKNGLFVLNDTVFKWDQDILFNRIIVTRGLISIDEDYLLSRFGINGEIKVLYGSLDTKDLIITDYLARCFLDTVNDPNIPIDFDELNKLGLAAKIGCVIETDYSVKYKEFFSLAKLAKEQHLNKYDYIKNNIKNKLFKEFINDILNKYAYTYTFSKDIKADFIDKLEKPHHLTNCYSYINGSDSMTYNEYINVYDYGGNSLKDNEVILDQDLYKTFFNTILTPSLIENFKPFTFTIARYEDNDLNNEPIKIELKCVGLGSKSRFSKEAVKMLNNFQYYLSGIDFLGGNDSSSLRELCKDYDLVPYNYDSFSYPLIKTLLKGFGGFILLIAIILLIASISFIIGYGINNIKSSFYEIGVLKALGCKTMDIGIIFILKIFITGCFISLLSFGGIILFTNLSNNILVNSFQHFANVTFFNVRIIGLRYRLIFLDLFLTVVITLISSIIPLIYLRKIKPIVILRKRS